MYVSVVVVSVLDVVEFDNSFSYLRSKTIWYAISVDSFGDKRTSA